MTTPNAARPEMAAPEYSVPALEKALDILELLADRAGGLTQSEIADSVGRSVSQIFRVLVTLERRGYLLRDRQAGLYFFSSRMFDLAHRHPPLRGLVQVAIGPMRDLAARISQSCNLGLLDHGVVRIIAQAESPADFGYRVRVGAEFPVESTATGTVLTSGTAYLTRADPLQPGITDVVVAIRGPEGEVVAALTVPYIATTFSALDAAAVLAAARATATEIGLALGVSPVAAR
jgi:DNA-binding IclR family transcriptional regulator